MSKKSQSRLERDRQVNAPVTQEQKLTKEFNYAKGSISLKFSLRVDSVTDLESFKELILIAVTDIDKELERLKNN